MFTLPVPASATASHGSGSNESSLGSRQKGEKKKRIRHALSLATAAEFGSRLSETAGAGCALAAVATAKAAFLKRTVCYANERNHLQPLKHQACFNYTLISSINTPHSGRAGRRRRGADNYPPTPDYTRRRRRGERLKNVTAPTVAAKPNGPSLTPLLKLAMVGVGGARLKRRQSAIKPFQLRKWANLAS